MVCRPSMPPSLHSQNKFSTNCFYPCQPATHTHTHQPLQHGPPFWALRLYLIMGGRGRGFSLYERYQSAAVFCVFTQLYTLPSLLCFPRPLLPGAREKFDKVTQNPLTPTSFSSVLHLSLSLSPSPCLSVTSTFSGYSLILSVSLHAPAGSVRPLI